ncbi:hypothetical protein [Streptomyces cyaneofuscatus]|uniref:hypothetical protein n=1 Tax=Streptomyces cyaneofuscatus TaxID=66883 RepID=UPI0033B98930
MAANPIRMTALWYGPRADAVTRWIARARAAPAAAIRSGAPEAGASPQVRGGALSVHRYQG